MEKHRTHDHYMINVVSSNPATASVFIPWQDNYAVVKDVSGNRNGLSWKIQTWLNTLINIVFVWRQLDTQFSRYACFWFLCTLLFLPILITLMNKIVKWSWICNFVNILLEYIMVVMYVCKGSLTVSLLWKTPRKNFALKLGQSVPSVLRSLC